MAFIPVPDSAEVALRFMWSGQRVTITLKYDRPGGISASQANNLIDVVQNWYTSDWRTHLTEGIALETIAARDLSQAQGWVIERPVTTGQTGTNTSGSLPNNAALTVRFLSGLAGRSNRGRIYIPGLPWDAAESSVTIKPARALGYLASMVALADAVTAAGFRHVIVSRYNNKVPRATGVRVPVIGYGIDLYLDSQRRRLAQRGM